MEKTDFSNCDLHTLTGSLQYARLKNWLDNCNYQKINEGDTIKFTNSLYNHVYKNCTFVVLSKFHDLERYFNCRLISYNPDSKYNYEDIILNLSKYEYEKILNITKQTKSAEHSKYIPSLKFYDGDYDCEESEYSSDFETDLSDSSDSLTIEEKTESVFKLLDLSFQTSMKSMLVNSKMDVIPEIEEVEMQTFDTSNLRNIEMFINKEDSLDEISSIHSHTDSSEDLLSKPNFIYNPFDLPDICNLQDIGFLNANSKIISPFDLEENNNLVKTSKPLQPYELPESCNYSKFEPLNPLKPFKLFNNKVNILEKIDMGKIIPSIKSPEKICKINNFMEASESIDLLEKVGKKSQTFSTFKIDDLIVEDLEVMSIESIDNSLDQIINESISDFNNEKNYNQVLHELESNKSQKLILEINDIYSENVNPDNETLDIEHTFTKIDDLKDTCIHMQTNITPLKYESSLHELLRVVKTKELTHELQEENFQEICITKPVITDITETPETTTPETTTPETTTPETTTPETTTPEENTKGVLYDSFEKIENINEILNKNLLEELNIKEIHAVTDTTESEISIPSSDDDDFFLDDSIIKENHLDIENRNPKTPEAQNPQEQPKTHLQENYKVYQSTTSLIDIDSEDDDEIQPVSNCTVM